MSDAIEYADSPQARQMDRDIASRSGASAKTSSLDERFAQMRDFWARANANSEIEAVASRARVNAAMVKVEAILGPRRK